MSKTISDLVSFCTDCLGKPYVLGANGPNEYDCSSLLCCACDEIFSKEIPRSSTDQYSIGTEVSKENLQIGDFVFFDTGWTDRKPNHVGIYIGNRKFINANSYNEKVVEDSLNTDYWKNAWYGAKRVFTTTGEWFSELINPETSCFPDVDLNHPEYEFIAQLKESGVVNGDSQTGNFRPNDTLNRAECLKIVLEFFQVSIANSSIHPFLDIPANEWYEKYVTTAYSQGIVSGYEDGTFRPANPVTRAEAVKIIFATKEENLSDIAGSQWFKKYTNEAQTREMLLPTSGDIDPHRSITRAEMARAICEA